MYRLHQPDKWGWTMLHHAANTGQAPVTEWLLQNNARPHQLSLSRKKAADVARHQGCLRLLRTAMMVDRGLVFDGIFHEKKVKYVFQIGATCVILLPIQPTPRVDLCACACVCVCVCICVFLASIPHGQLWVASWAKTDYQWLMHNKVSELGLSWAALASLDPAYHFQSRCCLCLCGCPVIPDQQHSRGA